MLPYCSLSEIFWANKTDKGLPATTHLWSWESPSRHFRAYHIEFHVNFSVIRNTPHATSLKWWQSQLVRDSMTCVHISTLSNLLIDWISYKHCTMHTYNPGFTQCKSWPFNWSFLSVWVVGKWSSSQLSLPIILQSSHVNSSLHGWALSSQWGCTRKSLWASAQSSLLLWAWWESLLDMAHDGTPLCTRVWYPCSRFHGSCIRQKLLIMLLASLS